MKFIDSLNNDYMGDIRVLTCIKNPSFKYKYDIGDIVEIVHHGHRHDRAPIVYSYDGLYAIIRGFCFDTTEPTYYITFIDYPYVSTISEDSKNYVSCFNYLETELKVPALKF